MTYQVTRERRCCTFQKFLGLLQKNLTHWRASRLLNRSAIHWADRHFFNLNVGTSIVLVAVPLGPNPSPRTIDPRAAPRRCNTDVSCRSMYVGSKEPKQGLRRPASTGRRIVNEREGAAGPPKTFNPGSGQMFRSGRKILQAGSGRGETRCEPRAMGSPGRTLVITEFGGGGGSGAWLRVVWGSGCQ